MRTVRRVFCLLATAALVVAQCMSFPGEQTRHFVLEGQYGLCFSNMDRIIVLLHESLTKHASSVTIRCTVQGDYMDELKSMTDEMMNLAMYNTDSPKEGDYVRFQYGGYKLTYERAKENGQNAYTITITPVYYTTTAEEEQVDARVAKIVSGLDLDKKTSDYEKIKAVYDYVCNNVSYDYVHVNNPHYYRDSTAYAALVSGYASCQGYAVALFRLLKEVGITAEVVTGTATNANGKKEFHAWNRVELNGKYYNLDATWDAGNGEYTFFMKADEEFVRHEPAADGA